MARRNQGINVKVPKVKVIKALEQALVKLENNYKNQEAEGKKYQLVYDKWHKQVVKLATAKFNKGENVRVNVRYNGSINIEISLTPFIGFAIAKLEVVSRRINKMFFTDMIFYFLNLYLFISLN